MLAVFHEGNQYSIKREKNVKGAWEIVDVVRNLRVQWKRRIRERQAKLKNIDKKSVWPSKSRLQIYWLFDEYFLTSWNDSGTLLG